MAESYLNWLKQAEEDLDSAEKNISIKKYYVSAFMSQQSAEKGLKSIIIKKYKELFKIHDLVVLGNKAKVPSNLIAKCEILSKVYADSRYDILDEIPAEKFNKEDAEEFLVIAKEVIKWVKKEI